MIKRVEPNIHPSLLVTNSFFVNREKGLQLFYWLCDSLSNYYELIMVAFTLLSL